MNNKSLNIVVIGGNAAGPAAAAKAKRTNPDSEVTLIESASFISTGTCELPYLLENKINSYKDIVFFDENTFYQEKNVRVKINSTVKKIDRKSKNIIVYDSIKNENIILNYDKLILSTGSYIPNILQVIGNPVNFSTFKTVNDFIKIKAYFNKNAVQKVLIIGAGFTGLEVADALTNIGKSVVICDKEKVLAENSDDLRVCLKSLMESKGIELLDSNNNLQFIQNKSRITNYKIDSKVFEVDYVIQCTGVKPNNFLGESSGLSIGKFGGLKIDNKLRTSDSNIFAAGDNIEVPEFITGKSIYLPIATLARKFGHIAGANAAGSNYYITPVIKNVTFQFGNKAFAFVGLSLDELKKLNYKYIQVKAESKNLVHVMPDSEKVHGIIYVDQNSNYILGGEFWGNKIIASYADIVSLYIRNKIKANSLADEIFNYSPPISPMINLLHILGQKLKKEI